jgi:hypothetical protein
VTQSAKGHDNLFGRQILRRGATFHLDMGSRRRDATVHDDDLWRAYKEQGCTTKEESFGKTRRTRELCDSEENEKG